MTTHCDTQRASEGGEGGRKEAIGGPQHCTAAASEVDHALGLSGIHPHLGVEGVIAASGSMGFALPQKVMFWHLISVSNASLLHSATQFAAGIETSKPRTAEAAAKQYLRFSQAMVKMEAAVSCQYLAVANTPV